MFTTSTNAELSIVITTVILLLLTTFIISIFFYYQKRQFAYVSELEKLKNEHENTLLTTKLEIQENTIQSISRDIHDNINLTLTLAKLNLNTIFTDNKNNSTENIQNAIELVGTAINDLTNLSRSMNADLLKEQGLIHALSHEIKKLSKLKRFEMETVITGEPVFMEFQKELFIFRIIQEAFSNILKHSKADHVRLELNYQENGLCVRVVDNGIGMDHLIQDQKNKSSTGIINMQKRAALIGGNCEITGKVDSGSIVSINVPY